MKITSKAMTISWYEKDEQLKLWLIEKAKEDDRSITNEVKHLLKSIMEKDSVSCETIGDRNAGSPKTTEIQ